MTTMSFASTLVLASSAETAASVGIGVLVIGFTIASIVLFVAGLVSALRSGNYAAAGKAIWVLLMFAFPVLGPITWFLWGRKSTLAPTPRAPAG
ncbi:PLD nuclease N-terminal domain-containing protein [Nocardia sp. NPDC050710]|uniref:PLD nuclease N-terminal domain-containing protein n=1 Tax=Nocardia sp. NPDC050710 TaxID=3157220 RepID=UPI0033E984CC